MAKRGQRLPFKVEYKYPAHPRPYRVAKADKDSALLLGRDLARRGAAVRVYHRDPDTRVETDIASYDVTAWEVQAQRALDTLNAKGAPASATLAELHDVDTAAYRMLVEALAAMAPVTGEEVEPEHLALAGLRPTAGGLFETSDHDRISHSWIVSSRDIDRCPSAQLPAEPLPPRRHMPLPEQRGHPAVTTIDVYRIPMSGPPQLATITPDLDGMQAAVGGMIEVVTLVDGVDMYVDEEGKLKRRIRPNVNATRVVEHYRPGFSRRDVIYGDAVVAGMDEDGETVSVPDHIAAAITDILKAEGVDA